MYVYTQITKPWIGYTCELLNCIIIIICLIKKRKLLCINICLENLDNSPEIQILIIINYSLKLKISGNKLYQTLRLGTSRGGTAICMKQHIPHYTVQNITFTGLHYTGIVVVYHIIILTLFHYTHDIHGIYQSLRLNNSFRKICTV